MSTLSEPGAEAVLPPLSATREELAALSVDRLDQLIAASKEHMLKASDPDEVQRLTVELDWLLDARIAVAARASEDTPAGAAVIVEGVRYAMPEKLTMGEAADLEELIGSSDPAASSVRLMLGMTWIALRRRDSSWTLERVRALDFDVVQQVEGDARPPGRAETA